MHWFRGPDYPIIHCCSLLMQLFILIILMKHLILLHVLQAAGCVGLCGPDSCWRELLSIAFVSLFLTFNRIPYVSLSYSFIFLSSFLVHYELILFIFHPPAVFANKSSLALHLYLYYDTCMLRSLTARILLQWYITILYNTSTYVHIYLYSWNHYTKNNRICVRFFHYH